MKDRKIFVGLAAIAIGCFSFITTSAIHAQSSVSLEEGIPSDLVLDLALAQQNPAPEQKAIVNSETKQAEVVSDTGTTTVIPADVVVPEVKTESQDNALHPEQTTSEQVIMTPDTVEDNSANQENNQNPTSNDNLIPGTTITEPDDNAVPVAPLIPQQNDQNPATDTNQPASEPQSSGQPFQTNDTPQDQPPPDGSTQGVAIGPTLFQQIMQRAVQKILYILSTH